MQYKVDLASLEWRSSAIGSRCKVFRTGGRQMRLLEITPEFVEPAWCEKGHLGLVLEGELEVTFGDGALRYGPGVGIVIPGGAAGRHQARSLAPLTRLFLVEDVDDDAVDTAERP